MANIQKKSVSTEELTVKLQELKYNDELAVGDMFFYGRSDEGTVIRISEIRKEKTYDKKSTYIEIHFDQNKDYDCTEWSSYGSKKIEEFIKECGHRKLKKSPAEYRQEALDIIEGRKSIEEYKDKTFESENTDTALMAFSNKEVYKVLAAELEKKKQTALLLRAAVGLEMARKKAELEAIRKNLGLILADFKKKIEKIHKVIWTIELYLGIEEDIIQIQDGEKADIKEPIVLRQALMYMDEEIGDVMDDGKGLDFTNIEQFDAWLLKYSSWYKKANYEVLVPEQKCIVS